MTAYATATVEPGRGAWQPWPRLQVRLPPELFAAIKQKAANDDRTMASVVRNAAGEALGVEVDDPPMLGQRRSPDNAATSRRKTLPPALAAALLEAHRRTEASYRAVAAALDIDPAMWWRMTRGTRCPSRPVAQRIINRLNLNDEVATRLLEESVETRWK